MELDNTHEWTGEVEEILEKLRINCVNLCEYHRQQYYHYKGYGKYFRIPLILLASVNSTASVGLQPVLEQQIISGITCLIGMIMGILGAIELYLGIQDAMELELKQSKEYYTLAIGIYKMLSLRRENRGGDGRDYLNSQYSYYVKLCEASNLLTRKLKMDMLVTIPDYTIDSPSIILNTTKNKNMSNYKESIYRQPRQSVSIGSNKAVQLNQLQMLNDKIPDSVNSTTIQTITTEGQSLLEPHDIDNTTNNVDTENTDSKENLVEPKETI